MKKGFILPLILIIIAVALFFWFKNKSSTKLTDTATTTGTILNSTSSSPTTSTSTPQDKNPLLSPTQEQALEKFGIDPGSLPKSLTPAMVTCAKEKLGEARASELLKGATPTMADFFKARSCF